MLIYEYRIVLPMAVDEYKVAQLYSVAEASKNATGGGDGIEVKVNEPYDSSSPKEYQPDYPLPEPYTSGQYTFKYYHLQNKVPGIVKMLFRDPNALSIREKAWNAYPYCRTILDNPKYMGEDNFFIKIESIHLADRGNTKNAHQLDQKQLNERKEFFVDLFEPEPYYSEYNKANPGEYKSEKCPGRFPLRKKWYETCEPVMCAYKLVTCYFKWWGLQNKVEALIQKSERKIFTKFHRELCCFTDEWYGKTMEDIRALEEETKKDLDDEREKGALKNWVEKEEAD